MKNVITKSNQNIFDKIVNKAKELNLSFKSDFLTFPKICNKSNFNSEQICPNDAIRYLFDKPKIEEYYLNIYNNYNISNYVFKCKKDDDTLFVNSKGRVSACVCLQNISYKYKQKNLIDIILKLKKPFMLKYPKSTKCSNCKLLPLCRYCPAKFYLSTKSYYKPPQWYYEFGL